MHFKICNFFVIYISKKFSKYSPIIYRTGGEYITTTFLNHISSTLKYLSFVSYIKCKLYYFLKYNFQLFKI